MLWVASLVFFNSAQAAFELSMQSDVDLTNFVSRPDIKVPILDVHLLSEQDALPGHWFLAPYNNISQDPHPFAVYQACQIGPTIYDNYGEVLWAGACHVRNQNSHDFRPTTINGSDHLTFVKAGNHRNGLKGSGAVMNSSYDLVLEVHPRPGIPHFDMHEFRVLQEQGRLTALFLIQRPIIADVSYLGHSLHRDGWLSDCGFTEVDVDTGEILFEWWASNHISHAESYFNYPGMSFTNAMKPYDWFHANSVEKNAKGDYLVSARYTSAIYKISGRDGSVLWRLGGKRSDFELERGFNFSYQHDARWISYNDHEEVISFLDNAADSIMNLNTSETSSGLIVTLNKKTRTAHPTQRWRRPDMGLSRLRGNFQAYIHSTNVICSWSDNGYITELDASGRVLVDTRFRSRRMVTYRAYKANFTGTPHTQPDVAAFAFGTSLDYSLTVVYMSWNGATELAFWNVYGSNKTGDVLTLMGSTPKTGFETLYQLPKFYASIAVEALGRDGRPLPFGKSQVIAVQSKIELEHELDRGNVSTSGQDRGSKDEL